MAALLAVPLIFELYLMYLFKKSADLQAFLADYRSRNRQIGFVPTMGALHKGHLSLLDASQNTAHVTVCSIFVNPTQFNESADLEHYPRTPGRDIDLLHKAGCDILFMPEVEEVYPVKYEVPVPDVELGHLAEVMEGEHRPGHFEGVMQVVLRLLHLVQPDFLFMGQKDYQQLTIIREMIRQLSLQVELVGCPTLREPDGLAMSSRNVRLSPEDRSRALAINQTLAEAGSWAGALSPAEIQEKALNALREAGLVPEYFKLADAENLQLVDAFEAGREVIACAAARAGEVRLIDNRVIYPG